MSVLQLKMQARQALVHHKLNMIYVCLVIGLFNLIPSVVLQTPFRSFSPVFLILLFATVHGYVTSIRKSGRSGFYSSLYRAVSNLSDQEYSGLSAADYRCSHRQFDATAWLSDDFQDY